MVPDVFAGIAFQAALFLSSFHGARVSGIVNSRKRRRASVLSSQGEAAPVTERRTTQGLVLTAVMKEKAKQGCSHCILNKEKVAHPPEYLIMCSEAGGVHLISFNKPRGLASKFLKPQSPY